MSVKVFRIEKAVPLPDLPDADAMCSDIRNSESNDVLFQLSKELTGENHKTESTKNFQQLCEAIDLATEAKHIKLEMETALQDLKSHQSEYNSARYT